jgi:hypothetical protein
MFLNTLVTFDTLLSPSQLTRISILQVTFIFEAAFYFLLLLFYHHLAGHLDVTGMRPKIIIILRLIGPLSLFFCSPSSVSVSS